MQYVSIDHNIIKTEINSSKLSGKSSYIWKLKNRLLSNPWVKEESRGESESILKLDEDKNPTSRNVCDAAKEGLQAMSRFTD